MTNPAPPKYLELPVELLVPRACREHVLGDMRERYTSRLGYITDAASAVPAAIVSQIRRATPASFLLLEALVVYASFLAAAVWLRGFDGPPDLAGLARNTVIVMAGLLLRDAYSARPSPSRFKLIANVYLSIYFSCGAQWIWWWARPNVNLSPRIMTSVLGIFISSILISWLKIWIETLREDRPRGVR